jgi:hypothetical protein
MNPSTIAERLAKLGPQLPGLDPFMARFYFHQSWFRSEILDVPYAEYGHLLQPEDGEKGLNFYGGNTAFVAKNISKSWLFKFQTDFINDLSSAEAFALTIFEELNRDSGIATNLLNLLLESKEPVQFCQALINFVEEKYLPYNITFDACINYRVDPSHRKGLLGVCFLRSDAKPLPAYPFHSVPEYDYIARWPNANWLLEALLETFDEPRYNKLWRQYMLLMAKLRAEQSKGYLIVVHHPQDKETIQTIHHYLTFLQPNNSTFIPIGLDMLLEAINKAINAQDWKTRIRLDGPDHLEGMDMATFHAEHLQREHQTWQRGAKTLHQRYVDFSASDTLWQAYQKREQF